LDSLSLSDGSAVGSSETDSDAVGFGAASSSLEEFVRAKMARSTTPAMTRKRMPFEFFLAGAAGAATGFAGAGVLVTGVAPRAGTGGITIFEASTFAADFAADFFATARLADFLTGRFAAAFLAGRFVALFTDFFTAFFAGRFAAAFLTGRLAEAFFFAATTTPLFNLRTDE
jgi:hypothetical protein